MTEQEIVQCVAVGIVAFWVGVIVTQKKLGAQSQQSQQMQGANDGSGAFAMDWFTNWGKGP